MGSRENRRDGRGRRGSALVFVLMVLTSLLVLSAGFQQLTAVRTAELRHDEADLRAFYLAEAGMNEAMTALRAGSSGNVGSQNQPAYLAGGLLWTVATDLGGGRTQLDVTALAGRGRAAIEAVVEDLGSAPLFPSVLNSREQLTLNSSVVIDSYDSALGSYASQAVNSTNGYTHANKNGDVTSNEGIVLNSGAQVFGDATPGPGYSVSLSAGAYVDGTTTPAGAAFSFPPVVRPPIPQAGAMALANGGSATLPPGNHGFTSLDLGKDSTLVVQGPATILVDDFVGGRDARLQIDATGGPVTIYVTDTYTHNNGFEAVAGPGSPMALAFLLESANPILFPASSRVRGAYYAPNADITFTSSNEAWGAFAGNRVDMSANMRFHYDETLAQHWDADTGQNANTMQVLSWRRTEVPSQLRAARGDPFELLNVNPQALFSPADAWN